jgi:hypothetical protein
MKVKEFGKKLYEGLLILKKPVLIASGVVFFLILLGISFLGKIIASNFQTTSSNIIWVAVVALVSFGFGAYVFAGMIGAAVGRGFFRSANKFWFRNFIIVLFVVLASILIGRIAHYAAFYIGRAMSLDTTSAVILFFLLYFIGLVGAMIFLTFSSFFLVARGLKIDGAVRDSASFVKRNYLATLILNVLFFALFFLSDWIPNVLGDVILFGLVLPYFVAVLTRFVETVDLKKSKK